MDLGLQFRKSRPAETTRCHCSLAAVQGHSRGGSPIILDGSCRLGRLAGLPSYIYIASLACSFMVMPSSRYFAEMAKREMKEVIGCTDCLKKCQIYNSVSSFKTSENKTTHAVDPRRHLPDGQAAMGMVTCSCPSWPNDQKRPELVAEPNQGSAPGHYSTGKLRRHGGSCVRSCRSM